MALGKHSQFVYRQRLNSEKRGLAAMCGPKFWGSHAVGIRISFCKRKFYRGLSPNGVDTKTSLINMDNSSLIQRVAAAVRPIYYHPASGLVMKELVTYDWWIPFCASLCCIGAFACLLAFRLRALLCEIRSRRKRQVHLVPPPQSIQSTNSVMIVLGSGGHTAEMITLIRDVISYNSIPQKFVYVSGDTDNHSAAKIARVYTTEEQYIPHAQHAEFHTVPRAREVGQSWTSSFFSSIRTLLASFILVMKTKPDLIICNGPGTCVVICAAALVLRAMGRGSWGRIIYVESFARVKTLSLSGKILYHFADRFIVQWSSLRELYPLAEYYGRLA